MSRKKKMYPTCVSLPNDLLDHMKKICLTMSRQKGRVISVSEFIRETMMECYPIPKQGNLFEKKPVKKFILNPSETPPEPFSLSDPLDQKEQSD